MPKLAAFDHAGWLKGLTLDFTAWDGVQIRLSKVKAAKAAHVVKPAISVLTTEFDNIGHSLEEHRTRVDYYGRRYDRGTELFNNAPIVDPDESRNINKTRCNDAWRDTRHAAHNDEEGLKLLRDAFLAMHAANGD